MDEAKITMCGRVKPSSVRKAALYLSKHFPIHSRSDLMSACFDLVASIAEQQGGKIEIKNNKHAFEVLEKLGLKFESKRAKKEKLYALKLDALEGLEPEQRAKISSIIENMRKGGRPVTSKEAKKSRLLIEVEKIEAEIQEEERIESLNN